MNRRQADRFARGLQQALVPPRRPNLLVVAWRWRYELIGLSALVLLGLVLSRTGTPGVIVACCAASVALGVLSRWRAARRWLATRFWCVVTPHRLRAACVQARLHTTRGRLPVILRCSPAPHGEAVLVWLPAGVTAESLHAQRRLVAAACYAAEARIFPDPLHRHLATVHVIRVPDPGKEA